MVYNKKHKMVLQAIMHEGALNETVGRELILKLFEKNNTMEVISEINSKLRLLNLTIKCVNCEVTGQLYWILISTVQDTTARFHPEFSEAELALLRKIFSEIVTSNDGHVSSTWCLNLCSLLNFKLSKVNAEEFLYKMVDKKWLSCKDGQYYIGVRSIAELFQYFKNTCEDNLRTCILCKQTLFYGETCKNCEAVTHIHCLKAYVKNRNSMACPNCHHSESGQVQPGGDTNSALGIDNSDAEAEMSQPSQKKKLKRKYKR